MKAAGWLVIVGAGGLSGCSNEFSLRSAAEPADVVDTGTPAPPPLDTGTPTVPPPIDPTIPIASAPIYAHTLDELFRFDNQTLTYTLVGPFRQGDAVVTDMTDIAIDFDGALWGITSTELFRINPDTADVEPQCTVRGLPVGLTFTSTGTLYMGSEQVYTLDPDDCRQAPVTAFDLYITSGDLVPLPDRRLYWTVWNLTGGTGDLMVRVDVDNRDTVVIGDTQEPAIWGLGYADDVLYGFSALGRIVAIDPVTGASEVVLTTPYEWAGATTNPVTW